CGRPVKRGRPWPILVEEMACPAEEGEVVSGHILEFEIQALRFATLIEKPDTLDNIPIDHWSTLSRTVSRSECIRALYCAAQRLNLLCTDCKIERGPTPLDGHVVRPTAST